MKQKAIVLLSGGMDSATTLAIAKDRGYELYCISYQYGQIASKEIECAKKLVEKYDVVEHKIVDIGFLSDLVKGKSALVSNSVLELPIEETEKIPISYVPFRNTILLSIAVAWAESIDANYIYIGANSVDYSGYPDCRPVYFDVFTSLIKYGTKAGVEGREIKIRVPLIDMSKKDIVRTGNDLGVPFELTWSCYKGEDAPCGTCDSCKLRERGFSDAGIKDPLLD